MGLLPGRQVSSRKSRARDNGKEHGNYYNGLYRDYIGYILGIYRDNGKANGSYGLKFRVLGVEGFRVPLNILQGFKKRTAFDHVRAVARIYLQAKRRTSLGNSSKNLPPFSNYGASDKHRLHSKS